MDRPIVRKPKVNMSDKNAELERRAVALVKQYGLFMPAPVKAFLREMAEHLNWNDLKGKI